MNFSLPQIKLLYHFKMFIESDEAHLRASGFSPKTVRALLGMGLIELDVENPVRTYQLSNYGRNLISNIEYARSEAPQEYTEDFFERTKLLANHIKSRKRI